MKSDDVLPIAIFNWRDTEILVNGQKVAGFMGAFDWNGKGAKATVSLTSGFDTKFSGKGKLTFKYHNFIIDFFFDEVNLNRFYNKGEGGIPLMDLTFVNNEESGLRGNFVIPE